MEGHVRLGYRLGVKPRDLLELRNGHDRRAALRGRRGHQQGLLGRHRGRGQMVGTDLLRHQLLLDFVDQD